LLEHEIAYRQPAVDHAGSEFQRLPAAFVPSESIGGKPEGRLTVASAFGNASEAESRVTNDALGIAMKTTQGCQRSHPHWKPRPRHPRRQPLLGTERNIQAKEASKQTGLDAESHTRGPRQLDFQTVELTPSHKSTLER
jgi:hypothetical protein